MKFKPLVLCLFVLGASLIASAQAAFTTTTLSAAVNTPSVAGQPGSPTVNLTSASGVTCSTTVTTYLFVDRELMQCVAVNGTVITVSRGANGTAATTHASGAVVWVGPATNFISNRNSGFYSGTCTPNAQLSLPVINTDTGQFYNCIGGTTTALTGKWVVGDGTTFPRWRVNSPEPGAVAYTGINTNGTATGATTLYCTEVYLPTNKMLTGIGVLNGTTVGTDNHYVVLYSAGGGVSLANSAVAGAVSAGASVYQPYAFTGQYLALRGDYFACVQSNGTTDTLRMAITGVNDNILTKGQTGATFGTVPSLTVPTTFTTAVGPYIYLY